MVKANAEDPDVFTGYCYFLSIIFSNILPVPMEDFYFFPREKSPYTDQEQPKYFMINTDLDHIHYFSGTLLIFPC